MYRAIGARLARQHIAKRAASRAGGYVNTLNTNTKGRLIPRSFVSDAVRGAAAAAATQTTTATHTSSPPLPAKEQNASPKFEDDLPLIKTDERRIRVGWDPLTWSNYHNVWLRDNCRCSECFHQITKQRLLNTFDIPPEIHPGKVEATPDGLEVTWVSPSHTSFYPWDWLKWNSYDPELPNRGDLLPYRPKEKVLWGARIAQDPPSIEHDYIMNDDKGLWKLLKRIETFGFSFVTGVPTNVDDTEKLTRRIGRIRETQYGGFWDFTSDLAKGDTAYTTLALPAHTDTTYFTDPCGLQLFHLLSHTEGKGGESLLVDGFYVASILKELHPEAYDVLASVRVPTHAAGELGELFRPKPSSGYPILNIDPTNGELIQVRYNNDDRSVMRSISPDTLEKWYEALRLWNSLLKSADSEYWVQLTPGTVVVLDNHRVLHGRSAFTGKRRMCGAYVGIDDFRSKLTVLTERFIKGAATHPTEEGGRSTWSPLF